MSADLKSIIEAEIEASGAMRLDRFMGLCNAHYYATRDPLGVDGDFVTAPEVSQMFGEILGAWAVQAWMDMGSPQGFVLLELGPGRGTLMADMLRVGAAFREHAQVHLVESSPVLREKQALALAGYDPVWHAGLETVPDGLPMIVIANEFFDALPVRQEVKIDGEWRERMIAKDFAWNYTPDDAAHIRELSPAREGFMAALAGRMAQAKSAGLIIDYGHKQSAAGETFQALKAHEFVDPFKSIGDADLTAHVDFETLGKVAANMGLDVQPIVEQGAFLKALGIEARAAYLQSKGAKTVAADLHRLIAPSEMGGLFKVMELRCEL